MAFKLDNVSSYHHFWFYEKASSLQFSKQQLLRESNVTHTAKVSMPMNTPLHVEISNDHNCSSLYCLYQNTTKMGLTWWL